MKHFLLPLLSTGILLAACHNNPYYNPEKIHHTPKGFRNNAAHAPHGHLDLITWQWQRFWAGLPKEPAGGYGFEVLAPNKHLLATSAQAPRLTWIGHATLLLQIGEVNILTDPQFSQRASPLSSMGPKRRVAPAISIRDLPHIHVVVISHNHYDHLDQASVTQLNQQAGGPPHFFVPLGVKAWFTKLGIEHVSELDWWEKRDYQGLEVHFLPVQHFSARYPWDRNQSLWGSWLLAHPQFRFFFAGDTGYSPDFREIGKRIGPIDLAALPIGAYAPRWFMQAMHINPEEAVRIHHDLGARYSVAMHWGTFAMTDEPLDEPPQRLAAARAAAGILPEEFFILRHGETRTLRFADAP